MTAKWPLPFVLVLGISATRAAGPTVTIDTASPAGKVSPLFYGLMTEEINHAYDGGLYAELVRNRAFLDDAAAPAHWSLVQADGSAATMALDPKEPLNTSIGTSLRLNVTQASTGHAAGITNEGYWGIPVKPNTRYRASFYAKAAPGFTGPVAVSIQSDDGRTIYATKTVSGLTSVMEAVRIHAPDRQKRDTHREGALRAHGRSPRHRLVQPGLAVPADIQGSAERIPSRHHADDGGHEAEVSAFSGRQLPRGRSDRRSIRVEEDDRSAVRSPRAHGAVGLSLDRRAGPPRIPALVRGYERRTPAGSVRGLLPQGRARESGAGSRTVRAGRARRDRVRDGPGDLEVGRAAREGRSSGAVQADLRRGGKRGLVRQVGFLRSALRAIQHGDQGAVSAAQSDLDCRLRAAGGSARQERQARRARRALLPDRRRVPENGARAVRRSTIAAARRSSSANGPPTKRRSSRGTLARAASRRRRTCAPPSATPRS